MGVYAGLAEGNIQVYTGCLLDTHAWPFHHDWLFSVYQNGAPQPYACANKMSYPSEQGQGNHRLCLLAEAVSKINPPSLKLLSEAFGLQKWETWRPVSVFPAVTANVFTHPSCLSLGHLVSFTLRFLKACFWRLLPKARAPVPLLSLFSLFVLY